MSYSERINDKDIGSYETLDDWNDYYERFCEVFETRETDGDISKAEFKVKNKIFNQTVYFNGTYLAKIKFENCYFLGGIKFYDCNIANYFSINHCFCDDELFIFESTTFDKEFGIINLILQRQLYVEGGNFEKCKWSFGELATVKIAGGNYQELNIGYWGGANLKELTLDNRKTSGYIKISGEQTYIQNFLVFQTSKDLEISIEDINVNVLSIYRYRNEDGFRIINVKPFTSEKPSEFSITESFMGKAEFYSINLEAFDFVTVFNSHILDSTFVNIQWPISIQALKGSSIGLSEVEKLLPQKLSELTKDWFAQDNFGFALREDPACITYFKNQRDTYRQLKFALGKQGDVINEQKFHAQEMLAYDKSLSLEDNFWTVAIIKFSHWFSDFGQSVYKPLLGLILGHLILVFLLIHFSGFQNLEISFHQPSMDGFKLAFQKYFFLINPLRKYEDVFPGYTILLDIIMRIWSSFMLYNLIRSTRRFIK